MSSTGRPTPPKPPPPPPRGVPRAHPRVRVRVAAEVESGGLRFTVVVRDLSTAGAGLELERPLEEGALVSLSLFPVVDDIEDETAAPLALSARIVWCAPDDNNRAIAGVRFESVSPAMKEWIAQYVERASIPPKTG